MLSLTEIAKKYKTDKCLRHNYIQNFYEKIFNPLRNKKLNLLEIGIKNGASLRTWKEFFINAEIYGIDIDKVNVEGCHTEKCNQVYCQDIFQDIQFDIIIDDGSHNWDHQQISFDILFPRLKKGGIYLIEDLHTSFIDKFSSIGYRPTLELMKERSDTEIYYDIHGGIISKTKK